MVDPYHNQGGHTPYSLVYGSEAVLSVEVGIPSLRITFYDGPSNDQIKPIALDLLPEIRGDALLRSITQKQRIARYFNRRVRQKPISVGDFVLRKIEATGKAPQLGKLSPNWEGPYQVIEQIGSGTFRLTTMDGEPLNRPWNADNLRRFYI